MATYEALFRAVADFSKVRSEAKATSDALGGMGDGVDGANEKVKRGVPEIGNTITNGATKIVKAGAVALAGVAAGVVTTAFVKGWSRLTAIDTAKQKLLGLKMPAEQVEQVMKDALASVKGTAYGLGDAATVAASAVAAGVQPGEDLERTLKLVADAAFIGGASMSDMGSIFNKVAAKNKVSGDVLNQLGERGIPILQFLSKQLGVTTEDVVDLVSKGKVSFDDFRAAMETGLGGAAQQSGATFQGAVDNILASLGRMGANVLQPIFDRVKDALPGVLEAMQSVEPAFKGVGEAIAWLADNGEMLVPILAGLAAGLLTALAPAIWAAVTATWAWTTALLANPFTWIVVGVAALVAAIVWLVQNWDTAVAWITDVWGAIVGWLAGVWDAIVAGVTSFGKSVVAFFVGIWDSIVDTAKAVWNGILSFFQTILDNLLFIIIGPIGTLVLFIIANWDRITEATRQIWDAIVAFIASIPQRILAGIAFLSTLPGKVAVWFQGVLTEAQNKFNAVVSFIAGIPGRIFDGLVALGQLAAKAAVWFLGFLNAAKDKFNDTVAWIKSVPSKIMSALGNLGSLLTSSGKKLVDGFLKGIKSAWDGLTSWVKKGMENLRGLWPFSPAKWGPFSGRGYVTYSGEALGEDWAGSLVKQEPTVGSAAEGLIQAAARALRSAGDLNLDAAVRLTPVEVFTRQAAATSTAYTSSITDVSTTTSQGTIYHLYLNDWEIGMNSELEDAVRDIVGIVADARRLDRVSGGTA